MIPNDYIETGDIRIYSCKSLSVYRAQPQCKTCNSKFFVVLVISVYTGMVVSLIMIANFNINYCCMHIALITIIKHSSHILKK